MNAPEASGSAAPPRDGRAGKVSAGFWVLAAAGLIFTAIALVPGSPVKGEAVGSTFDMAGRASVVPLAGEWEDVSGPSSALAILPIQWEEPYGRAVYRLRLKGLDPAIRYALKLPAIDTSFRLSANGALVAKGGVPGASARETFAAYAPGVAALPRGASELELELEIANFANVRGGIIRPILLGEEEAVRRADLVSNLSVGLVEGLLFVIGLLFAFNAAAKRSATSLLMGLAYLAGAVSILFISHEVHSWRLFPAMSWDFYDRAAYMSSLAFPLLVLAAARSHFGGLGSKGFAALAAPAALFQLVFLLLPPAVYIKGIFVYEAYAIFLLIAALAICVRAVRKGYPHAWLVTLGFAALALETFSAVLFINAKSHASTFLPLSFLYAFFEPSGGLALAIDLASIAMALFAFNAFGVILFLGAARAGREPPAEASTLPSARARCEAIGLTPREADVALLALAGKRNAEIGAALGISENTVKTHLSRVFAKADIRSRAELYAYFGSR
jgi:DNA-binding CsgD family transcriptional regulator